MPAHSRTVMRRFTAALLLGGDEATGGDRA
jgi:hypothetical protein